MKNFKLNRTPIDIGVKKKHLFLKSLLIAIGLLVTNLTTQTWADQGEFYNMYLSYTFEGAAGSVSGDDKNTGVSVDAGTLTSGSLVLTGVYLKCWDDFGYGNYKSSGGQLCYTNKGGSTQYISCGAHTSKSGNNYEYQNSNPGLTIASYNQASGSYAFESWGQTWDWDGSGSSGDWYFPYSSGHYVINYKIAPPAISGFSVAKSGYLSGAGTSGNPYLIAYNGTLTLTVSGSKAHTDANSTIKYWKNSGAKQNTNVLTVSGITSPDLTSVVVHTQCINNSLSSLGGTESTETIYYKVANYTITLDDNGDYQGNGSATALYGKNALTINSTPSRTGYHVDGYYEEAEETNLIATSAGALQASTSYTTSGSLWNSTSNQTLYTKWAPNTYTLTFNADDASRVGTATNVQGSVTVTFDDKNFSAATVKVPVLAGYTFGGYYTATNGGGVQIVNASGVWQSNKANYLDGSGNWIKAANTTLYAKWTEIKSTITINTPSSYQGTLSTTGNKSLGVQTTQSVTATAANGHKFHQWQKTGNAVLTSTTSNPTTVKADGSGNAGTVSAQFISRFALIGSDTDDHYGAAVNGMPGWSDYSKTLDYVAANDFERTLTLKGNTTYKFRLRDYTLDQNLGYASSGTITVDDKSTTYWLNNYNADVQFTLNGSDDITFKITGFSGAHVTLQVLTSNNSLSYHTATFNGRNFYLNGSSATGTTGGTVTAIDGKGFALTTGQKVKAGGKVIFTAAPKTGYTFDGWYSDAACNTAYVDNSGTILIDEENNTLELNTLAADKTVYAKFTEKATTVAIAANYSDRGSVRVAGAAHTWGNTVNVGVTTGKALVATPAAGYYFAGWEKTEGTDFKLGSDASSDYDEDASSRTLYGKGAGSGSGQTLTANFLPLEKVYFRNWNEDSKARLWDKVYVYFSISYENDGSSQPCAKSNSSADFYTEMEQIGSTNVYWAYVPRATTRKINACDDDIAFSNHDFGKNYKFNGYEAVMRGDYRTNLSMFVPRHANTYTRNGTKYYGGYWKHHNKAAGSFSGYSIVRYTGSGYVDPAKNGEDVRSFMVKDENTIQYSLRVDNLTDDHNRFMIYSDAEIHYITYNTSPAEGGYNITTANCTNVHMSEYTSGSPRFEIEPTSEGMYTLTIDMSSDEMKLSVNYPVAVGDYRLKHTYSSTYTTYSDVIKSGATSTTASMYLNPSSSPTLVLEKCTAVSPLTWTVQGSNVWTTHSSKFDDGKGVYQFDIAISNNAISTLTNVGLYEGNFYIKTDCAPGGWTSYKTNILDKNTINFSKSDATTFDYYMCKNVGAGTNVKFVIANDYNIAITDSIKADATYLTGGNNENTPSEGSCVRFSYNSVTNEAKRAYMRYSNQTNFLNIIPSAASKVYDAASAGNDLYGASGAASANNKFGDDDGNFVYRKTVYAVSGATIDVKAEYTTSSKKQDFVTGHKPITSNNESTRYPIQVVYDFKTNNLTTAWHPGEDPISDVISKVDYMYIRDGQAAADQLSFGVGGALTESKVCGAFQFEYDDYVGKVGAWPQQAGQSTGYTYSKCMFYFSFPFNVKVSDIFGIGTYGKEWKIQYYDGAERAKKGFFRGDGTTTFWKDMSLGDTLKAYIGYSLLLDNDYFNTTAEGMVFKGKSAGSSVYLYFPSYQTMSSITSMTKDLTIAPLECKLENTWYDADSKQTLSHKNTDSHWNMLGVPLLNSQTGDFSSKFTQSGLSYLYAWNSTTNTLTPAATGSGAGAVGNFTFQAMGAYMVQFTGTIRFTGAVPTPSAIAARQKEETKNYTVDLEVLDGEDTRINHTYVELREGASDDFMLNEDMYMTRNSNAVNIYSFAGDYDVAANVLSLGNHVVPVGVAVKKAGTYKFSMPYEFSGTVTLVDKFNNTRTNLAFDEYEVYLEKGSINDRFDMEINIHKVPTSIENVDGNNALNDGGVHKFIENDQMYILKNGTIYNAQGAKVK